MAITAEYTTAPLRVAPSAAASASVTPNASAWADSNYTEITASTSEAWVLAGIQFNAGIAADFEFQVATGAAGAETVIATIPGNVETADIGGLQWIPVPIPIDNIASGARVAVRMRKSGTNVTAWGVKIAYYKQSEFGSTATKTTQALKCLPSAAAGVSVTPNGTAWANSAYTEVTASMPANAVLAGVVMNSGIAQPHEIDISVGAASSEVVKTTFRIVNDSNAGANYWVPHLPPWDGFASGDRVTVRVRKQGTATTAETFKIAYYEKPL